jgi:hypothetical protein
MRTVIHPAIQVQGQASRTVPECDESWLNRLVHRTRFTSPACGWGKLSPHERCDSRRHPHPSPPAQAQGYRIWGKVWSDSFCAAHPSRRPRRAPQDEDFFRGKIVDPHGEGAAKPRVSNHEAYTITAKEQPYAIALPASGRGSAASSLPLSDLISSRANRARDRARRLDRRSRCPWAVRRSARIRRSGCRRADTSSRRS